MAALPSLDRLYGTVLWHATGHRGVRWTLPSGETLRIDPRCRWIRHPGYEAAVVEFLRARVRAGDACVDVGAHVGFYALQMALWSAPAGRVIAFEPNPIARASLVRNVRLNALDRRVIVDPRAVGARDGAATLFGAGDTSGLSRMQAPNPASAPARPVHVDVTSLDAYCARHGVRPRCILVDAEGAELDVLRGARQTLAGTDCEIAIELHQDLWGTFGATAESLVDFTREIGRRIVGLTGQGDPLTEYGTISLAR